MEWKTKCQREKKVKACQKVLKLHLAANGKRLHRLLQKEAAPFAHQQRKPQGLALGNLRRGLEPPPAPPEAVAVKEVEGSQHWRDIGTLIPRPCPSHHPLSIPHPQPRCLWMQGVVRGIKGLQSRRPERPLYLVAEPRPGREGA